jgi:hypothetical protein
LKEAQFGMTFACRGGEREAAAAHRYSNMPKHLPPPLWFSAYCAVIPTKRSEEESRTIDNCLNHDLSDFYDSYDKKSHKSKQSQKSQF